MKTVLLSLLLIHFSITLFAQRANFELAERFSAEKLAEMTGDLTISGEWLKKTDKFWYSYKDQGGRQFILVDAERRSKAPLFDREKMAMKLTRLTNKPYNALDLPLKNIRFTDDNQTLKFELDSINFEFNLLQKTLAKKDVVEKDTLRGLL